MPEKQKRIAREEKILKVEYPFGDSRGRIDYHVLPEPVNWVGIITSKKGAVRANHYHPEQEQKLLLVSGSCISVYKDLAIQNSPIKHHLVKPGELVITPPNIAHAVIYLEDSVQINLVAGERNPANYGKHTKPYELVKREEVEKYISEYK